MFTHFNNKTNNATPHFEVFKKSDLTTQYCFIIDEFESITLDIN